MSFDTTCRTRAVEPRSRCMRLPWRACGPPPPHVPDPTSLSLSPVIATAILLSGRLISRPFARSLFMNAPKACGLSRARALRQSAAQGGGVHDFTISASARDESAACGGASQRTSITRYGSGIGTVGKSGDTAERLPLVIASARTPALICGARRREDDTATALPASLRGAGRRPCTGRGPRHARTLRKAEARGRTLTCRRTQKRAAGRLLAARRSDTGSGGGGEGRARIWARVQCVIAGNRSTGRSAPRGRGWD